MENVTLADAMSHTMTLTVMSISQLCSEHAKEDRHRHDFWSRVTVIVGSVSFVNLTILPAVGP